MSSTVSCIHEKFKYRCVICSPKYTCIHNKYSKICIKCNPKITCEHNRRKSGCFICYPNMKCKHDKSKYSCKMCNKHKSRSKKNTQNVHTTTDKYIKLNTFDSLINAFEKTSQMHIEKVEKVCVHQYIHSDCIYCYMMELKL